MSEPAGVPRADDVCITCGLRVNLWCPNSWHLRDKPMRTDERTPDEAPAPERHECNCEYCEARPCSERIATVEVSLKDCQNPECPVGCPDSHAVYLGEDPPEAAKQPAPPVSAQELHAIAKTCKGHGWMDWAAKLEQLADWLPAPPDPKEKI